MVGFRNKKCLEELKYEMTEELVNTKIDINEIKSTLDYIARCVTVKAAQPTVYRHPITGKVEYMVMLTADEMCNIYTAIAMCSDELNKISDSII